MAKGRQPGKGEAYWRRVVQQQAASGGTIRDFCRRNRLRESTFYFWRRQLQRRDSERPPARVAFVPVSVKPEAAEPAAREDPEGTQVGRIEIVLPAGQCIGLTPPVDRQALTNVLLAVSNAERAVLSLDPDAHPGEPRPC
jgi:transposase-like protein